MYSLHLLYMAANVKIQPINIIPKLVILKGKTDMYRNVESEICWKKKIEMSLTVEHQ